MMDMQKFIDAWEMEDSFDEEVYLDRGRILCEAKEALGHGQFQQFLVKIDCPKTTAARYMRIYNTARKVPTLAFLKLPSSKLDILARIPEEMLCNYVAAHASEIKNMSVRELTRTVRGMLHPAEEKHIQEDDSEANETDVSQTITIELSADHLKAVEEMRQDLYPNRSITEVCVFALLKLVDEYHAFSEEAQAQL